MNINKVLITGSCGLVGSESVKYFANIGCQVTGIDTNMRKKWFGEAGDTAPVRNELEEIRNYNHLDLDVTATYEMRRIVGMIEPDLIIHAAAQPSHEKSAEAPLVDFKVNTCGTINLLDAARQESPDATFIFVSTNKVYGCLRKLSEHCKIKEEEFRMKAVVPTDDGFYEEYKGIDENWSLDQSVHSPFGASKASADLFTQEYGLYYGLNTACFRCGCISGGAHQGVEQHGFLAYICKCAKEDKEYTIYGHGGKQVRDNMHAYDLATAFHEYAKNPSPGAVYNIGGGYANSCSILEVIKIIEGKIGKKVATVEGDPRKGDHLLYYTNYSKFQKRYPDWKITKNLNEIISEILDNNFLV